MSCVIGLDPGPEKSALVLFDGERVTGTLFAENNAILGQIHGYPIYGIPSIPLVIEQVASFGMPVGAEVFETVFWSGRFAEAYGFDRVRRITRVQVKMALCHNTRAKDANIRQALIDLYGGKERAIGKKASPGPLYGISGDLWSALAVAIAWSKTGGR